VTAPEPEPPPPAAPAEQNALPFVVAIEAHRELLVALERVADLTEIEPELLFHVEPLERQGTLFYHVMAGPVRDSAAALALRDSLIARGHKTGPTPTDVRATPLAYLIGDYGTPDAAQEQSDVLRRLDIPAYVLEAEAVDGRPLYRLYVGGFGSAAEADIMGQMLRSAGIRDSLVTRTGNVTAADFLDTQGDSMTARDSLATRTGSIIP
jgi:cell division septation protein DedD